MQDNAEYPQPRVDMFELQQGEDGTFGVREKSTGHVVHTLGKNRSIATRVVRSWNDGHITDPKDFPQIAEGEVFDAIREGIAARFPEARVAGSAGTITVHQFGQTFIINAYEQPM